MSTPQHGARAGAQTRLNSEAARLAKLRLTELFAADPERAAKLSLDAPHLHADFSKQKIDLAALEALAALAEAADFDAWRAKMFAGEIVNSTEDRPAKHWALRDLDNQEEVRAVWERM